MKDAFGGILNIVLIAIFLLIVEGVLGLAVNYTKAFKMKNAVISFYEKYQGICWEGTDCFAKIEEEAKRIGYSKMTDLHCYDDKDTGAPAVNVGDYFCYVRNDSNSKKNYVYTIETQVDINIPIINKIMGLSFFRAHGDTRVIKK